MATITIVEYYGEINAEFGVITFGKMPFSVVNTEVESMQSFHPFLLRITLNCLRIYSLISLQLLMLISESISSNYNRDQSVHWNFA